MEAAWERKNVGTNDTGDLSSAPGAHPLIYSSRAVYADLGSALDDVMRGGCGMIVIDDTATATDVKHVQDRLDAEDQHRSWWEV